MLPLVEDLEKILRCRQTESQKRRGAGRARATIREIPGSHAVYVANPDAIAALIKGVLVGKPG
jgi:hypothetical protein